MRTHKASSVKSKHSRTDKHFGHLNLCRHDVSHIQQFSFRHENFLIQHWWQKRNNVSTFESTSCHFLMHNRHTLILQLVHTKRQQRIRVQYQQSVILPQEVSHFQLHRKESSQNLYERQDSLFMDQLHVLNLQKYKAKSR